MQTAMSISTLYNLTKEMEKITSGELEKKRKIEKLLELEAKHQQGIIKLSQDEVFLEQSVSQLEKSDDHLMRVLVLSIIIESQNPDVLKLAIALDAYLIYEGHPYRFVSDDAFSVFVECFMSYYKEEKTQIPLEKILEHVYTKKLDALVPLLLDERFYPEGSLELEILELLAPFDQSKVLIDKYACKFDVKTLFMAGLAEKALRVLANREDMDVDEDENYYLVRYGSSDAIKVLKSYADRLIEKNDDDVHKVHVYFRFMETLSEHKTLPSKTNIYWLYEMMKVCHTKESDSFELTQEILKQMPYLLGVETSEQFEEIRSVIETFAWEGNDASQQAVLDYMRTTILDKAQEIQKVKKIIYPFGDGALDIELDAKAGKLEFSKMLDSFMLFHSVYVSADLLEDLIIYTGAYFPLSYTGYYTTRLSEVARWKTYLKANEEALKVGQWLRYGKNIDDESVYDYLDAPLKNADAIDRLFDGSLLKEEMGVQIC